MDLYLAILGLMLPSLISLAFAGETCSDPSASSITAFTAEKFLVGTELIYICDSDHFAGLTNEVFYKCENSNGVNKWTSGYCSCRKINGTTTNTQIGEDSSDCEISTNGNETIPKDYCGPAPAVHNAELKLSQSQFPVGQELHYHFQCNDWDKNRSHGVLKCQAINKSVQWLNSSDECIKKSNGPHPTETQCTESNGPHQAETTQCTGINVPCVIVTVGVLTVIVVIYAVFKIVLRRKKSTPKCKFLQRRTVPAHKEEEMMSTNVPLNKDQERQCAV